MFSLDPLALKDLVLSSGVAAGLKAELRTRLLEIMTTQAGRGDER